MVQWEQDHREFYVVHLLNYIIIRNEFDRFHDRVWQDFLHYGNGTIVRYFRLWFYDRIPLKSVRINSKHTKRCFRSETTKLKR